MYSSSEVATGLDPAGVANETTSTDIETRATRMRRIECPLMDLVKPPD
jgi:hypothetical protein